MNRTKSNKCLNTQQVFKTQKNITQEKVNRNRPRNKIDGKISRKTVLKTTITLPRPKKAEENMNMIRKE